MENVINQIKGKSFLVTGGAGFIGSNICEFLLGNEAKLVRVLDNLSNGHLKNIAPFLDLSNFEFMEEDIRNFDSCTKAVEGIEYVTHQAALGSVPRSIKDPITTNEVNISGFLNILTAVKDSNTVKKMVYAASSSTYGDSPTLPKVEENIGNPLSPYAVTKYVNELYADVFHKTYGTKTIGLRYFNIFGPKQDPNGAYAAVIPLFIDAITKGNAPTMNGDGKQTRDFTFVENAIQANICAMFAGEEADNQVFNIACAERISLNTLWNELQAISGITLIAKYGPNRQGDVRDSLADISKADLLLGYKPQVTVREGLRKTYEWFINNTEFINS